MDRTIKKDIRKRYKTLLERYGAMTYDRQASFLCEQCNHVINTRFEDDGDIPMGIECPYCQGNAMSLTEWELAENVPVTFKWVRPTLDEVLQMAEKGELFTVNYVLCGGLVRRPC